MLINKDKKNPQSTALDLFLLRQNPIAHSRVYVKNKLEEGEISLCRQEAAWWFISLVLPVQSGPRYTQQVWQHLKYSYYQSNIVFFRVVGHPV